MEAFELMIASVTVNLCVLLAMSISCLQQRRLKGRERSSRRCQDEEMAPATDVTLEVKQNHSTVTSSMKDVMTDSHKVTQKSSTMSDVTEGVIVSNIITSAFSFVAGICMTMSPYVWQCPFVCKSPPSLESLSKVSPGGHSSNNWSSYDKVSLFLLSAAFGCFVFAFSHLVYACVRSGRWTLWSIIRSGYLFISIVTICVVMSTNEGLLGANLILLMEVDASVEGICQLVDSCSVHRNLRVARILLSLVGCVTSFGIRIVTTWVLCLSLGRVYNPIAMSVLSLGVASFGVIFYQAYALFMVKQQADRLRRIIRDEDLITSTKDMMVEPYGGKTMAYGLRGRKDVAVHLVSEGLIEMSTYAKTVAGVITGKKLIPIKTLCESLMPLNKDQQVAVSSKAVR